MLYTIYILVQILTLGFYFRIIVFFLIRLNFVDTF